MKKVNTEQPTPRGRIGRRIHLSVFGAASPKGALDRNFYTYLVGFGLSTFGDSVSLLALTFAVLTLTNSAADLALVLIAGRLPVIAFIVFGGVIGDRWSRKRVMVAADVVRFSSQGVLAILLITQQAEIWHIVALHALGGIAFAFYSPASSGMIRDIVEVDALQRANGIINLVRNFCSMLALGVSALLVAKVGAGYAIAIDALTFALSAALVCTIVPRTESRMAVGLSMATQLKDGFDYLRQKIWIMVVVVHGGLINGFVIAPVMVLGPLVAQTHLDGATSWATIGIATTIGALFGSILGIRLKIDRLIPAGIAVVLAAGPMIVLLALAAPTPWIAASAVLFGAQSSIYMTATQTALQQHVEGAFIGRISAYMSLGGLVLMPTGLGLAGLAAERFGTASVLIFAAFVLVISTLAALAFPQVRARSLTTKSGNNK